MYTVRTWIAVDQYLLDVKKEVRQVDYESINKATIGAVCQQRVTHPMCPGTNGQERGQKRKHTAGHDYCATGY